MTSQEKKHPTGSVRVTNARRDMMPDAQPEPGETVLWVDRRNEALGNRHTLRAKADMAERDRVVAAYGKDLDADFDAKGPMFLAIREIAQRIVGGERICLQCHCRPSPCHADLIEKKVRVLVAKLRATT